MAVQSNQHNNRASRTETTHHDASPQHQSTSGRGWHGDPEGHAEAGRKGGQKVARNKEHMASIGRKGGEAVSRDRQHMAEIGRKGGQARGEGNRK